MCKARTILPCHNSARWIGRAVESLLAQTCENFELVIINDGSTDNSTEMIAPYICDEQVRYTYRTNRGFSAALNRGIEESIGCLMACAEALLENIAKSFKAKC